jgi:hypothetical protein
MLSIDVGIESADEKGKRTGNENVRGYVDYLPSYVAQRLFSEVAVLPKRTSFR